MVFNQKIASIGLTGFFGAVFVAATPQLSVGLMITYGLISTALGFGIAAISKAVGDAFPDQDLPSSRDLGAPPPYDHANDLPSITRPAIIYPRRPVTQPFFENPFRKPPAHVVNHHIEASRPSVFPKPSAPPQFVAVPPPAAGMPFISTPPVLTFSKPATAPIVSKDPFHKPVAKVVDHKVVPSDQPILPLPGPITVSSNPFDKPAPRVVGRSIQPGR
jgi:hypothetical protein